jgi:hypothetical protein
METIPHRIAMNQGRHRKIIHIDMDAFYASVEQRDNPELRAKPVAVGGSAERGVVAAASYDARKFGVRSAMPWVTAKRQCPDLIFVKPRFDVYKAVSQQIREIFAEHTPIIEPLSLDKAYLDVTENLQRIPLARDVALAIRAKIKGVTGLNASAGISYNKTILFARGDFGLELGEIGAALMDNHHFSVEDRLTGDVQHAGDHRKPLPPVQPVAGEDPLLPRVEVDLDPVAVELDFM